MGEFNILSYLSLSGSLHNFSPSISPDSANCLLTLSLFEKSPAYSSPNATIIAPVNVARSTISSGLYCSCVYHRASARTNLPSASVFNTSIV